nr:hypothetical protein [Bacillus thuringiensis]
MCFVYNKMLADRMDSDKESQNRLINLLNILHLSNINLTFRF